MNIIRQTIEPTAYLCSIAACLFSASIAAAQSAGDETPRENQSILIERPAQDAAEENSNEPVEKSGDRNADVAEKAEENAARNQDRSVEVEEPTSGDIARPILPRVIEELPAPAFDNEAANANPNSSDAGNGRATVEPPTTRINQADSLRALAAAARRLDEQLEQLPTGEGWKRHLALPTDVFDADSAAAVTDEALSVVYVRFEKVSRNPEYRVIAELPAFQETQYLLATHLGIAQAAPARYNDRGPLFGRRSGVQFGGGAGVRFGGPGGAQFGGGQGARFGNAVQFGGGQGARFGNAVQFGGGQGVRIGRFYIGR